MARGQVLARERGIVEARLLVQMWEGAVVLA